MTRLERLLPALAALSGTTLRLWRAKTPGERPPNGDGAWFQPIPDIADTWLEVKGTGNGHGAVQLAEVVGAVMQAEVETTQVAAELSGRYEEIDLIYTISEILGHTIRLDEAANRILREVSAVVRARRATLLVHDPRAHVLRLIAARGVELGEIDPIEVCASSATIPPTRAPTSRRTRSSAATRAMRFSRCRWSMPRRAACPRPSASSI